MRDRQLVLKGGALDLPAARLLDDDDLDDLEEEAKVKAEKNKRESKS
jgi:hypothetical protein